MHKNAGIDDEEIPVDDTRAQQRARDATLVARVRAGEQDAFAELYQIWFDRVYHIALGIVRDPESAADVTQDAFLSAWRRLDSLDDSASFGGWLLRITRNAALNRVARDARSRSVDSQGLAMIEHQGSSPSSSPTGFDLSGRPTEIDDPARIAADAQMIAFVHEAAAALSDRDREVLDLQLRCHLAPAEIGEVLGLNRNATNQLCHRVKNHFAAAFGARMLVGSGTVPCPQLAAALSSGGAERFGPTTIRIVAAHLGDCPDCEERRRTKVAPAALFSAVPLAAAPLATRMMIARHLREAGVPTPTFPVASPDRGGSPLAKVLIALGVAAVIIAAVVVLGHRTSSRLPRMSATVSTTTSRQMSGGIVPATRPASSVAADHALSRSDSHRRTVTRTPSPRQTPTDPPLMTTPTTAVGPSTTVEPSPVVIENFTLTPTTSQPPNYARSTGPLLDWNVRDATSVTISLYYDDGTSGDRLLRIVATGTTGSLRVCPGSMTAPDTCSSAAGHYRYELVATTAAGTTFTAPQSPGFDVRPPIIG